MKSSEIRERFLRFFEKNGHTRLPSSSLIPAEDPTLLFTNAGMNQFKDYFLGLKQPPSPRATTSQKCVRAGGKHNDLENVGFTARHHTFFEMLGNFSFGDYFKDEAIDFAWTLLTKELSLPKDRLRISIYKDDDEAFEIWKKVGVKPDWIYRLGEKDNFWAMGDTGPCGPCTEIYWDWKPDSKDLKSTVETDDLRFLEIWNLVFMQFNRDTSGTLNPLPKPSVDTGGGLERWSCVLQNVFNNYDTDLFKDIREGITAITGIAYGASDMTDVSIRVLCDHMRAGVFLISDGVVPSNEGRGYVLRRILRRAIRHGKKLGKNEPFLHQLVSSVEKSLGSVYPDIVKNHNLVEQVFKEEEERFHLTLHRGMSLLQDNLEKAARSSQKMLPGEIAFQLYDTFGFPLDLTRVICDEHKIKLDEKGFEERMSQQKAQSSWNQGNKTQLADELARSLQGVKTKSEFLGYEGLSAESKVRVILDLNGKIIDKLSEGETGLVIFKKTPFYAESGGQVGDIGTLKGEGVEALIEETFKAANAHLHRLKVLSGCVEADTKYVLEVNKRRRSEIAVNHTATHMLHAALRKHLGDRVKQAGSLVDPDKLRFDFTFPRALTEEEIQAIEETISDEIWKDQPVSTVEMPYKEAIDHGAIAFFDEKYGDTVRVVRVGEKDERPYSVELCGGTHLTHSGQVGIFKIISESSISSGVRRIEAVTGRKAEHTLKERSQAAVTAAQHLRVPPQELVSKVTTLQKENKELSRKIEELELKVAAAGQSSGGDKSLWQKKKAIGELQLVAEEVPNANPKILRSLVDQVRDKLKEKTIVLLGSTTGDKAFLCLGLSKDLVGTYDAGKLVKDLAPTVEGTGGGKADFAQAGGSKPSGIPHAFKQLEEFLQGR